jgi:hypothetical protein
VQYSSGFSREVTNMHISVGSEADFDEYVSPAIKKQQDTLWTVPKRAREGDDVLLLIPSQHGSICAVGTVLETPSRSEHWDNKYAAMIGKVVRLRKPISIETLRKRFPKWGYPRYARGYTTVPAKLVAELEKMVAKAKR